MKIRCNREALLSAFTSAASVAPARSPKPVLRNVKLELAPSGSTLMATDLEIGVRVELEGIEADAPGAFLANVSQLGPILRESTDEWLNFETTDTAIVVKGERSRFKLPLTNLDEYPPVPEFSADGYHAVSGRLFRELIKRTIFATDSESSRYALGGVLLEFEPDHIVAVATDGRRLAKMEGPAIAVNQHGGHETMTIVPAKAMQFIERTITDADAEIKIAATANELLVKTSRVTIFSRLVEGRFPKWRDVFPRRTTSRKIELTVGPLLSALRQAAIMTNDESRGIEFRFGQGSLELNSMTAEVGEAHVEIPVAYNESPVVVNLDNRYVIDFLKVLDLAKSITVDLEDSEKAALMTSDDGYGYVIMPLSKPGDHRTS